MSEPQIPSGTVYLHAPADDLKPAVTLGQGLPVEINGQPCKYFWADGIRTGEYVHPTRGFKLAVDRARLDSWAGNFAKMRAAGIDVPVPVDHSTKARDNCGYIVDVKREGDTLKLLHQLIGEDAIRLASRNKVSLGIDPDYRDGKGTRWGDCVIHSSLTPVPVVQGQAGLIAASRDDDAAPLVFELSQHSDENPGGGVPPSPREIPQGATMDLSKLRAAFAVADDVADDQVIERAASRIAELSRDLDASKGQVQTLSRAASGPDKDVLLDRAETAESRVDLYADWGFVTVDQAKALKKLIKPDGQNPSAVMLSRGGDNQYPVDAFLKILEMGPKPAKLEKTGVQTLSRATPGEEEPDEAAAAGLAQGEAYKNAQLAARGLK